MSNYFRGYRPENRRDAELENRYNLATSDLAQAARAEERVFGKEGGEITEVFSLLEIYLTARGSQRLNERKAAAVVRRAILLDTPAENWGNLSAEQYGRMIEDATLHAAVLGERFWSGKMADYPMMLEEVSAGINPILDESLMLERAA